MNVGDKLYCVSKKYNVFSRHKITMVDENGTEWYRYDKPTVSIDLEVHTIVGKIESTHYGVVPVEEECEIATYFTNLDQIVYDSEIDADANWFTRERYALEFLEVEREQYAY